MACTRLSKCVGRQPRIKLSNLLFRVHCTRKKSYKPSIYELGTLSSGQLQTCNWRVLRINRQNNSFHILFLRSCIKKVLYESFLKIEITESQSLFGIVNKGGRTLIGIYSKLHLGFQLKTNFPRLSRYKMKFLWLYLNNWIWQQNFEYWCNFIPLVQQTYTVW